MQGLQLGYVGFELAAVQLVINAGIVHFAVIHNGGELDFGEAFFKRGFDAVLLLGRVAACVNDEFATFFDGILIKLV